MGIKLQEKFFHCHFPSSKSEKLATTSKTMNSNRGNYSILIAFSCLSFHSILLFPCFAWSMQVWLLLYLLSWATTATAKKKARPFQEPNSVDTSTALCCAALRCCTASGRVYRMGWKGKSETPKPKFPPWRLAGQPKSTTAETTHSNKHQRAKLAE